MKIEHSFSLNDNDDRFFYLVMTLLDTVIDNYHEVEILNKYYYFLKSLKSSTYKTENKNAEDFINNEIIYCEKIINFYDFKDDMDEDKVIDTIHKYFDNYMIIICIQVIRTKLFSNNETIN